MGDERQKSNRNHERKEYYMHLDTLGWNSFFQQQLESQDMTGFEVGRVAAENRTNYLIYSRYSELSGEVTGKLLFTSSSAELPKVGDWVVMSVFEDERKAIIHRILERKSRFSRKVAGKKTEEQVIAANIDLVFIVQGLDGNYNPRRLERYLVMACKSAAEPVIVLNKSDLCDDTAGRIAEVMGLTGDIPVFTVSAKTGYGIDALKNCICTGTTVAFIGSSGVGKSTIINTLLGKDIQRTGEVRESDSRGRHITARRELFIMPDGGLLIDTPGMRELQLWNAGDGIEETFADIESLAGECHFKDCTHTVETKCAVLEAVEEGTVPRSRYENYIKLRRELNFLETRQSTSSFLEKKRQDKILHKRIKQMNKTLYRRKFE